MGWFENQIEERRAADQQLLEDSFVRVAGVVMGQRNADKLRDERIITKSAIDEILKYYHCKPAEIPDTIKTVDEQLDYSLRPHGLMRRGVELTEGWYRDASGPMIALRLTRMMPSWPTRIIPTKKNAIRNHWNCSMFGSSVTML